MNKKYGFIFLFLAIILFSMFALYNYTDLFNKKTPIPIDSKNEENKIKYGYVKSHDIDSKIKISFPIEDNLVLED